jgi:hypothetical protein
MIGFPDEDFDSIRENVHGLEPCLVCNASRSSPRPYPGSRVVPDLQETDPRTVWPATSKAFLLDSRRNPDAPPSSRRSSTPSSVLRLLRQLMVQRDLRRIAAYETEWNELARRGQQGGGRRCRNHGRCRMKIAVIGLGSIGRRHLGTCAAIGVETPARRTTPPRPSVRSPAAQFPTRR